MPAPVATIQPPPPTRKILNQGPKNNANATSKNKPCSTSPSPKRRTLQKQRTPKKGRDIENDIICKFCKLM
jgi:hypothetical protein